MGENREKFGEKYMDFLIESSYWPTSFSYGIAYHADAFKETGENTPETKYTYEIKKLKRVGDTQCVSRYEIGFMCNLPIEITALHRYTRMITFKMKYFDYNTEFNVYCPINVSPEEFYDRVYSKIQKHFYSIKTGHPEFETFKSFYDEKKNTLFKKPLKKSIEAYHKKRYDDWLALREESKKNEDEPGCGLCYCGHTTYCECGDPSYEMFMEHVKNKNINLRDPNNGWKSIKEQL